MSTSSAEVWSILTSLSTVLGGPSDEKAVFACRNLLPWCLHILNQILHAVSDVDARVGFW